MRIKHFDQFQEEKKNEGVVISEDPKIIYKGIDKYGRYLYEHRNTKDPAPVFILVVPEYIPLVDVINKDVQEREKDFVASNTRSLKWKTYNAAVERAGGAVKPDEAVS